MFKSLLIVAVLAVLTAPTALARGRCGCNGAAPAAAAAPAPATAQAQSPQATRSFSYQPSVNESRGFYRVSPPSEMGVRGAASKILGNY